MVSCLPFLLFPGLFDIIAQLVYGSTISIWLYVGVVKKWLLCDFLHLGRLFAVIYLTYQAMSEGALYIGAYKHGL